MKNSPLPTKETETKRFIIKCLIQHRELHLFVKRRKKTKPFNEISKK